MRVPMAVLVGWKPCRCAWCSEVAGGHNGHQTYQCMTCLGTAGNPDRWISIRYEPPHQFDREPHPQVPAAWVYHPLGWTASED